MKAQKALQDFAAADTVNEDLLAAFEAEIADHEFQTKNELRPTSPDVHKFIMELPEDFITESDKPVIIAAPSTRRLSAFPVTARIQPHDFNEFIAVLCSTIT